MIGLAPNLARAARLRFEPITATVTGLRISAVDGTAFIDNLPANILAKCDGNHQITIRDADDRELVGVLKAQGVSETVGANPSSITTLNFTSVWTPVRCAIDNANTYTISEGQVNGGPLIGDTAITLGLHKSSFTSSLGVATTIRATSGYPVASALGNGVPMYSTWTINTVWFYTTAIAGSQTAISDALCQQVTAPSATGATIVSTKAGTTYNFASRNASFVYNAASYSVTVQRI